MPRALSNAEQLLGPRPRLRLVTQDQFVREIWVEGRAPIITIYDYDWGATAPYPAFDDEGVAFSPIKWRRPAWTLGLSLHRRMEASHTIAKQNLRKHLGLFDPVVPYVPIGCRISELLPDSSSSEFLRLQIPLPLFLAV